MIRVLRFLGNFCEAMWIFAKSWKRSYSLQCTAILLSSECKKFDYSLLCTKTCIKIRYYRY